MFDTNLLIVVPARGGSKRLPGKNLKQLGDRSLLAWTATAIQDSRINAPCLLTTDSKEIATAGRDLGWTAPFLRPVELASDTATSLDTVLHALDWWRSQESKDPELVMLLQATSPFRRGQDLKNGLTLFADNVDATAVVGVCDVRHNVMLQASEDGFLDSLERKATSDKVLAPNGAFYLVESRVLRDQRTFFPTKTIPLVMDEESSMDIDTEHDWSIAEVIVQKRLSERRHHKCE